MQTSQAVLLGVVNPTIPGEIFKYDNATQMFSLPTNNTDFTYTFLAGNLCYGVGVTIPVKLEVDSGASLLPLAITTQNITDFHFKITVNDGSGFQGFTVLESLPFTDGVLNQSAVDTATLVSSSTSTGLTLTSSCYMIQPISAGPHTATFSFSATTPDAFAAGGGGFLQTTMFGGNGNFEATLVPEPGSVALLCGMGMTGLVAVRRRRARK